MQFRVERESATLAELASANHAGAACDDDDDGHCHRSRLNLEAQNAPFVPKSGNTSASWRVCGCGERRQRPSARRRPCRWLLCSWDWGIFAMQLVQPSPMGGCKGESTFMSHCCDWKFGSSVNTDVGRKKNFVDQRSFSLAWKENFRAQLSLFSSNIWALTQSPCLFLYSNKSGFRVDWRRASRANRRRRF